MSLSLVDMFVSGLKCSFHSVRGCYPWFFWKSHKFRYETFWLSTFDCRVLCFFVFMVHGSWFMVYLWFIYVNDIGYPVSLTFWTNSLSTQMPIWERKKTLGITITSDTYMHVYVHISKLKSKSSAENPFMISIQLEHQIFIISWF